MEHVHQHEDCHCKPGIAAQTLNELDFDRGIWSAAINNECGRLQTLIAKGHLSDRDSTGFTALHYAARNGHQEICTILLAAGISVNDATNGGATALQRAAMMGHTAVVRLLLSHNANPTQKDNDGKTALHRAAENGRLDCCRLLVQHATELKHVRDVKQQAPIDLVTDRTTHATELRALLALPTGC